MNRENSLTGVARARASWRLVWLIPAALAMLAGLDAALLLLGLPAPVHTERLPDAHGMILVLGFVATLVSLERATALGRWYGYLAPALLGLGGITLLIEPVPMLFAKLILVAGTAAFTMIYIPLWRRQYDSALLTQLLAAALALAGTIVWLGQPTLARVLPWLIGFVVLTIAAERVELARITMGPKAPGRVLGFAWAVTIALVVSMVSADLGSMLLGAVLLVLTVWLVRHDVARRTIRASGVTRFMAACILAGYVWLVVGAALLLPGMPTSSLHYDALIHSFFLGYTFSMIMAHATTILPAVLGITLPYRAAFWGPAILLQISLVIRIGPGDGFGIIWAKQLGGALGIAALLLFFATAIASAVIATVSARRRAKS